MLYGILISALCLVLVCVSGTVNAQSTVPNEAEQVLFLIDDSSSMTSSAFAPPDTAASRWQVVQKNFPEWLGRLKNDTLVGGISVGGTCGAQPSIKLPVGSDRSELLRAVTQASPGGDTNLNAGLSASPGFFNLNVRGGKHIVLFSDGENTCSPNGSTCEIARQLHKDHGITIDIVAWVTSPKMVSEFQCVADATGGQFTSPKSRREWTNIPLPIFEPWRYVVLSLSILTLLFASTVSYRHAYHLLGWSSGTATLSAGMLLIAGIVAAYICLFARGEIFAAFVGLAVTAIVIGIAAGKSRKTLMTRRPLARSAVGLGLLFLVFSAGTTYANETVPLQCKKVVQGAPRFHHVLAIDASGSVVRDIEQMKLLLSCYGEMYTLPKEEVTLIAFGMDEQGSVKELRTFTVPDNGSTQILDQQLEDLRIQDPRRTKTYFQPLAAFLNKFLEKVRMEPVVAVLSDGKSDAYRDFDDRLINFREVSFESFGTRGIYSAPRMKGWQVAVQGGTNLDLTALFQHPLVEPKPSDARTTTSVIDPCLIDPPLTVRTEKLLTLRPGLNPLSQSLTGELRMTAQNGCASRFRSFKVELLRGGDRYLVGSVDNVLIDSAPHAFSFTFNLPKSAGSAGEGVVQIELQQGGAVRTLYPQEPATISIEQSSYLGLYGLPLALGVFALLLAVALSLYIVKARRMKEMNRPEMVKVLGAYAVPISRGQTITIGGAGCNLVVPGVPSGLVLGTAEWLGSRGELSIQSGTGLRMKIRGVETDQSTAKLGQPLQFTELKTGSTYDLTLLPGTTKEMGFASRDVAGAPDLYFKSASDPGSAKVLSINRSESQMPVNGLDSNNYI
jgi:hypothetical protein